MQADDRFDQLIEYNMRRIIIIIEIIIIIIIIIEKSLKKCSGETSHRPFSEKSKSSISLNKFNTVFFFYMSKLRAIDMY